MKKEKIIIVTEHQGKFREVVKCTQERADRFVKENAKPNTTIMKCVFPSNSKKPSRQFYCY